MGKTTTAQPNQRNIELHTDNLATAQHFARTITKISRASNLGWNKSSIIASITLTAPNPHDFLPLETYAKEQDSLLGLCIIMENKT